MPRPKSTNARMAHAAVDLASIEVNAASHQLRWQIVRRREGRKDVVLGYGQSPGSFDTLIQALRNPRELVIERRKRKPRGTE